MVLQYAPTFKSGQMRQQPEIVSKNAKGSEVEALTLRDEER